MSIIKPEAGAIPRYLFDEAQESIEILLQVVSDAQAVINPAYGFAVEKNLFRPKIEDLTKTNHLANIIIGSVVSDDAQSNFNKNHIVTYHIDCYSQGKNTDDLDDPQLLVPADQSAVSRLLYLCAMVEYGLTSLSNFYLGNDALKNNVIPDKIDLEFNPVDDSRESGTPYAPARFKYVCKFPYEMQDLENLPNLTDAFADVQTWATQILYTP
jgi:hypothetical protein